MSDCPCPFCVIVRERDKLKSDAAFLEAFADPPDMTTNQTTRDELRAENARLRAVLAQITDMAGVITDPVKTVFEMKRIARDALAQDIAKGKT